MEILTMESTLKRGKYADKSVSELVNIPEQIFSMIKEGYYFDDEVLSAAHIKKTIRDEKIYNRVFPNFDSQFMKPLSVDTASVKQIISEMNNTTNNENVSESTETFTDYENDIDNINYEGLVTDDEKEE